MGSRIGTLCGKTRLALAVVVESHTIAFILWFWPSNFHCYEEHFSFLSVLLLVSLNTLIYISIEITFSSSLQYVKLQNFLPSVSVIVTLLVTLNWVIFSHVNFHDTIKANSKPATFVSTFCISFRNKIKPHIIIVSTSLTEI